MVVRSSTMFHVLALAAHDDGVYGIYLISNPDKLQLVSEPERSTSRPGPRVAS